MLMYNIIHCNFNALFLIVQLVPDFDHWGLLAGHMYACTHVHKLHAKRAEITNVYMYM